MKNSQHHPRCQVYLHPAVARNPDAIRAIQQQVGLLLIIPPMKKPEQHKPAGSNEFNPWGGDTA